MRGEAGSIIWVFFIWGCFDCPWIRVAGARQTVSFVFLFLVFLKEMRMRGQFNSFSCFDSFRNLPPSQKLWKKTFKSTPMAILRTWTSVTSPKTRRKPQHPVKTASYIHHTNHSTRSLLLHTTQLQAKTIPKRKIQLQNHSFNVHQPNIQDVTTQHNHTIHCHTET